MRDNISPEEKLLKLIRGKREQSASAQRPPLTNPQKPKTSRLSSLSLSILKYLPLLNVNKIVFTAFIISCLYLVFTFVFPLFYPKKINLAIIAPDKAEEKKMISHEPKPFEFYSQGIRERQIFSSAEEQGSQKAAGAISNDLIKDLSLVGIITGDNPQAVIEDKKTQKSYYLTKGNYIGEFKVEDIQEGKIILNYNGQRFELYL